MKFRPVFFLLAALAAGGPAAGLLGAEAPKDPKIRLMEEGFAERDKGNFAAAKLKFEALLVLVPNDSSIRRLIAEMDARQQAAALAAAAPPPVVAAPAPGPAEAPPEILPRGAPAAGATPPSHPETAGATLMAVPVITEGKPPPGPGPTLPEGYAAALAKVEAEGVAFARTDGPDRLEKLMTYVQAQRALARLYARDGNYPLAMSTLDAALAALKTSVNELRAERDDYARKEQVEKQGVRVQHRR